MGHGTRRDVMGICAEAKECDGKRRAILAVAPAVAEKVPVSLPEGPPHTEEQRCMHMDTMHACGQSPTVTTSMHADHILASTVQT